MSEVTTTTAAEQQTTTSSPDVNSQIASSLWGEPIVNTPVPQETVAPTATENTTVTVLPEQTATPAIEEEILDVDDYFKNHFGVDASTAKAQWEQFRASQQAPREEIKWANDDSKKLYDLIRDGKTDDVYRVLDQQKQLERLEQYDINDVSKAAEIIKANLRFKHSELNSQQIDRLFTRQYNMPEKPVQGSEQDDAEFQIEYEHWKRQVADKEQDMIIDATLAKPELLKYKTQIVLPDIQPVNNVQQQPNQQELEAKQAEYFNHFKGLLEKEYQNFKGYNVTAIDGEVKLPISYGISPEDLSASKDLVLESLNGNKFLDARWFDESGNPKINQIQEDLYLLTNRDRIFQKIANEASAQRFLHHQKVQNNIKLNGVNTELTPPSGGKNTNQELAEKMWA